MTKRCIENKKLKLICISDNSICFANGKRFGQGTYKGLKKTAEWQSSRLMWVKEEPLHIHSYGL